MGYQTSLSDQLAIAVVEDHPHGVLQVLEFLVVEGLDFLIIDFAFVDKCEEDVGGESLDSEVEFFGNLALLESLVDASDVLPEGRVIIVLDAVVGPTVG